MMGNGHEREGEVKDDVNFLVWVFNTNSAISASGIVEEELAHGLYGRGQKEFKFEPSP